jgi:hypothetical protein
VRRVLLDENLPRRLAGHLSGLEVRTVAEAGWAGTGNGALLLLAEGEFDVFVTADQGMPYQQTLGALDLGIVVLRAGGTKLEDLQPIAPAITLAVTMVEPGQVLYVPSV